MRFKGILSINKREIVNVNVIYIVSNTDTYMHHYISLSFSVIHVIQNSNITLYHDFIAIILHAQFRLRVGA